MIWNPDPVIFSIGPFSVHWYGLMWGLCVLFIYWFFKYAHKVEGRNFEEIGHMPEYLFLGGIIGARMGNVLFYDLSYYLQNPIEILQVWKGGLASHGGGIGVLIAIFIFSRRNPKYTFWWILDRISVSICVGAGLIRIGNLLNSEIVGKVTNVPWAFAFVRNDGMSPLVYRHPSPLYEAIMVFAIFFLLFYLYKKEKWRSPGCLTGMYFTLAFTGRTLLEFFKDDAARTQLLNLPFVAIGLLLLARCYFNNQNKDNLAPTPTNR